MTEHVQQQDYGLFVRLTIGVVVALLINVLAIYALSLAIKERPQARLAQRMHQVRLETPPPLPTPREQQRKEEKKQNIEKALSAIAPDTHLTSLHEFTLPAQIVQIPSQSQWTGHIDIGDIEIGEHAVEIEQHARLKFMPNLERYYPRIAKRKRITGETTLELTVDTEGRVSKYDIVHSQPSGVFEQSVPALIPHIRYEPAMAGGKKVTEKRRIKLKWSMK